MARIFISYRRDDNSGLTGRIYDRLKAHFGHDSVFMDIDDIPLGVDFRKYLSDEVSKCDALVAVIGTRWWSIDESGRQRLDEPRDYVRIEIKAALTRDIPVIPTLVDNASFPKEEDLPADLREFAYRHAISIDSGRDFHTHVDRLIRGIELHFARVGESDNVDVNPVSLNMVREVFNETSGKQSHVSRVHPEDSSGRTAYEEEIHRLSLALEEAQQRLAELEEEQRFIKQARHIDGSARKYKDDIRKRNDALQEARQHIAELEGNVEKAEKEAHEMRVEFEKERRQRPEQAMSEQRIKRSRDASQGEAIQLEETHNQLNQGLSHLAELFAANDSKSVAEVVLSALDHLDNPTTYQELRGALPQIDASPALENILEACVDRFKDLNSIRTQLAGTEKPWYSKEIRILELLVSLTHNKPSWYKRFGVEFYLTYLDTPHFIGATTHNALRLVGDLGDQSAIPVLERIYQQGYGGNESMGEEYLEHISQALEQLRRVCPR